VLNAFFVCISAHVFTTMHSLAGKLFGKSMSLCCC